MLFNCHLGTFRDGTGYPGMLSIRVLSFLETSQENTVHPGILSIRGLE